jgi:hypothetical protein
MASKELRFLWAHILTVPSHVLRVSHEAKFNNITIDIWRLHVPVIKCENIPGILPGKYTPHVDILSIVIQIYVKHGAQQGSKDVFAHVVRRVLRDHNSETYELMHDYFPLRHIMIEIALTKVDFAISHNRVKVPLLV